MEHPGVDAVGGKLQVTVVKGNRRIPLLGGPAAARKSAPSEVGSAPETKASARVVPADAAACHRRPKLGAASSDEPNAESVAV